MSKSRIVAVLLVMGLSLGSIVTLAGQPADAQVIFVPTVRPVLVIWTLTSLGLVLGTYPSLPACHLAAWFLPFGTPYLCVPTYF